MNTAQQERPTTCGDGAVIGMSQNGQNQRKKRHKSESGERPQSEQE
jgi:hypothetical protein